MNKHIWPQKRIDELFEVQLGKMLSEKAKNGEQFRYLANFNVRWGFFDFSKVNEMHFNDREKEKYTLKKGDLLMCEGGEIGRCAVWNQIDTDIYYQKALHRIRAKNKTCTTDFLALYFLFLTQTGYLTRFVGETSIAHLTREKLIALKIPLPPSSVQKAIADLLSTWDDAIKKTERLIAMKDRKLKQLTKWLVFGHRRINTDSTYELIDGHFFKYPKDWSYIQIKNIAEELSVRNTNTHEQPTVLSCSKYEGFVNSLDYFGKKVFSDDTSNYKIIIKGQFGYPANHVEEGSIGLLEHCEMGIVSPIYVTFWTDAEKVFAPFLYKVLKTDVYRHIFQIRTSSSVDRRGSLRWGEFSKIRVALPSVEEQKQITETLNTAQSEIDLLKQVAEKYKEQKRGLMQKLLTGVWRVLH